MEMRGEALGNNAKTVDEMPVLFDVNNCADKDNAEKQNAISQAQENRWILKRAAERLLYGSRTAACHRYVLPMKRNQDGDLVPRPNVVDILRHKETESVFYGGLETCGSVWSCPICAPKISERRREELKKLSSYWTGENKSIYLLTFTFPHSSFDILSDLLGNFSAARKKFFQSRAWRNFKAVNSIKHSVYCLETTFGENGWHIHVHMVLLSESPCNAKIKIPLTLRQSWERSCLSYGLGKPNKHGLDIRLGDEAFNYITKWGIDLELTKQHIKHGREGNSTPFDLLREYADGDKQAGALFVEFAEAFKGKRQLVWSKGLKQEAGIIEKTDKEILEEKIEDTEIIETITRKEWDLVVKYDLRYPLLVQARQFGKVAVRDYLRILISGECRELENSQ